MNNNKMNNEIITRKNQEVVNMYNNSKNNVENGKMVCDDKIYVTNVILRFPEIEKNMFDNYFYKARDLDGYVKYGTNIIIPAKERETINMIANSIKKAAAIGRAEYGDSMEFINPLEKPERKTADPIGKFNYNIYAWSWNKKPKVFNIIGKEIHPTNRYLDCKYANATLSFNPFTVNGYLKVGCNIHEIQLLRERAKVEEFISDFGR
ncbi:MAG: DUF2815 family protein [Clostridia bacterium]|nr:DUF2815 family protein [Clostridia bacterium]